MVTDTNQTAAAGEGGALDPREAAKILDEADRQARRQFDPQPAVVVVVGAGVFLFGYGAVWWSMRDQQVYSGPALWSLAVLYGLIAVSAIVGGVVSNRAKSGVSVSGRARRQQLAQTAAFAAAGLGAWVVEGALRYRGVSFEIVYGVFGPTVPLIALAAAAAGVNAMRENWLQLGACVGIIAVASVSTFFGPLGAWGLTGLGCCLVLLAYAGALFVRQRRSSEISHDHQQA